MADLEKSQVEEYDHSPLEKFGTRNTTHGDVELSRAKTEATIDTVAASAVGGDWHDLPAGYYRSPKFIGTFFGVVLMAWSLYVGYVLPASTLAIINADLGAFLASYLFVSFF